MHILKYTLPKAFYILKNNPKPIPYQQIINIIYIINKPIQCSDTYMEMSKKAH